MQGVARTLSLRWKDYPSPSWNADLTVAAKCGRVHTKQLRRHAGCAVNLTPNARATFITVSNRGLAPGASAL